MKNQDDGEEDDPLSSADPLNEVTCQSYIHIYQSLLHVRVLKFVNCIEQINLANYLADFIVKFSHTDRQLFDKLCQVRLSSANC